VTALQAAGLVDALSGTGTFTVVAPTNGAFAALGANVVTRLTQPGNQQLLLSILNYHVVADVALKSTDLHDHQLIGTVQGQFLEVFLTSAYSAPGVYFQNAQVTRADLVATNGVLHKVDAVLLPQNVTLPLTVVDQVLSLPSLTTLGAL
jgi:uncharacterized surface protein with fasciclin (FAS1) repeats